MKQILILVAGLAAWPTGAQPTNSPPQRAAQTLESQTIQRPRPPAPVLPELRPNEAILGNRLYSGIAVQAAKTRNPLQLINPLAPPRYGSAQDNVVRDPIGQPSGLKFFATQF